MAAFLAKDRVQKQQDFLRGLMPRELFGRFRFLCRDGTVCNGAFLCFSESPDEVIDGCSTKCFVWKGTSPDEGLTDDYESRRGLLGQFEDALDFLKKALRLERRIGETGRSEEFEIPLDVLQEALANALVHRDYESRHESVEVNVFDDRVEVSSPGLLPPPLQISHISEIEDSHPRNPQIARIFYLSGYVERAGSGIRRMGTTLRRKGLPPPAFNETAGRFLRVVLKRPNRSSSAGQIAQAVAVPSLIVGREEELREIKSRLGVLGNKSETARIQILTAMRGLPGVGKTTIAAALAHDLDVQKTYPDGVLWASLGQKPELLSELATWGRALGTDDLLKCRDLQEATTRMAGLLQNKRMLLIVDDAWDVNHVIPFKVGGAGCAMLVTTRETSLANAIAPTDANVYLLGVLSDEKALELLKLLAPSVVSQFPGQSLELVRELEGLPLGIQVAGRMLKVEAGHGFGVSELLAELRAGKRILQAQAPVDRADLAKETIPTVAVLLQKSTDQLDSEIRERYASLAAFAPKPATFDLRAMQAVWQVEDPKPTVRVLVDRGLLEPVQGTNRYQMQALLVLHARSLCSHE